jgi:hypothetical protein
MSEHAERRCDACGQEYTPKNTRSRYCSHSCANKGIKTFGKVSYQTAMRLHVCEHCGETFSLPASNRNTNRFCCRSCFDLWNENRRVKKVIEHRVPKVERRRGNTQLVCVACGESFEAQRSDAMFCADCRNNGGYMRQYQRSRVGTCPCGQPSKTRNSKYCSSDCRKKFGRYSKPSPVDTAICLACGEEFSRPHGYVSKMRYCSNACSHTAIKSVRDKYVLTLNDKAVVFNSMWEVRFVAACERFGLRWERNTTHSVSGAFGEYTPDFIVNGGTIVEVKGHVREEALEKLDAGRAVWGERFVVIDKAALIRLESGDLEVVSQPQVRLDC